MKRCNACQEEFADKFSFCPVDGSPLMDAGINCDEEINHGRDARATLEIKHGRDARATGDFHLTMINSAGLARRLSSEVVFAIEQMRRVWPEFKREPITVARREITSLLIWLRSVLQPNAVLGLVSAVLLICCISLGVILLGGGHKADVAEYGEVVEVLDFRLPQQVIAANDDKIGTGTKGRVGFNVGKGEGSEAQQKFARGGGGSGNHDQLAASIGKPPVPSAIPAPINRPLPNPSLPAAGIDLDPALWRNLNAVAYGDPRSKSTVESKGPGDGGVIGTGQGFGDGAGDGNGFGPGYDGNIGGGRKQLGDNGVGGGTGGGRGGEQNHIYRQLDVTQRARVLAKPEPQYTEAARRNQVTGSVVLSVIFTEAGEISGIRAVKTLPDGLTEKAIAAARQIRFVPAVRDGRPVSVYMQLEYNFNLY
jgi:TonB family protein